MSISTITITYTSRLLCINLLYIDILARRTYHKDIKIGVCFSSQGSAGQNKQHLASKDTAKLDRETEELHHSKVGHDVGVLIQQGRQAKKWTQKDLATVSCLYSQNFSSFGNTVIRPLGPVIQKCIQS